MIEALLSHVIELAVWVAAYLALCLIAIPAFSERKRRRR